MIISDEAGSGKSVELFEIAKTLHYEYPERWTSLVDLKRHIEAFKSVEKIKTFQDFISDHILRNKTEFEQELFKEMFRDGKTFVLFDGFYEISPNYKNLLLHVLKLFKPGSGNRIFITTRPHLEADLEEALGKFVFRLEKFSEGSQRSYLAEYWKLVAFKSEEDLNALSNRLLKKFSEISRANFIGLPLLLSMTAEIFSNPTKENSLNKVESLNIASIFKEFVDKYLVRWKEGGNEISLKENVEIDREGGILEIHHSIAIKYIFGGRFSILEFNERDAEKIARVGLVRYHKAARTFQFIHETFAEYFVSDFICSHLNRKNRNPSHDCLSAIEIFIKAVNSYRVIETFLDQTLETTKLNLNEASWQSLGKNFSEIINDQYKFDILRQSLKTVNVNDNIVILLLSIGKYADEDVLLGMLGSRHGGNATALQIAATYRSSKIVSTLCNIIATRFDNPKRISWEIDHFKNVLFCAAENKNRGVLTALCEVLNSVFSKVEINFMFQHKWGGDSIIGHATEQSSDEVLNELLSLLPKYVPIEELKKLLTVSDSLKENCLHLAVSRGTKPEERVQRIIDFAKSIFNTNDLKTFLLQPGKRGRNVFHYAAQRWYKKIFETIIESTDDVLSSDDFKSMLMAKDSEGSNVLHMIAEHTKVRRLKELNLLLREYLFNGDVRSLLLQVNKKGENCFQLAAKNNQMNFQVFLETIGNLLPQEDQTRLLQESSLEIDIFNLASGKYTGEDVPVETIKILLTTKYREGRNAFQNAAFSGRVGFWNQIVAFAEGIFSVDEMKTFVIPYGSDRDGESCFHLAVGNLYGEEIFVAVTNSRWYWICRAVVETFKSVLSVEEQRKIVRQKYSDQKNVFHHAAKDFERLEYVIEYLSAILSSDEIKSMLKQKDSDGRNFLFYCPTDPRALKTLITLLTEILSKDEIKSFLLDKDCDGLNCFQYSVRFENSDSDVTRSLSNFIKTILNPDDQRKFFGAKNQNLFHLAVQNILDIRYSMSRRHKIFSIVRECLKGVLTDIEIKSMIQEKDSNGNNILHLICQNSKDDYCVLDDLFVVLKDVLDVDELKDFLTSSNNHGSNCLLLAVKSRGRSFLNRLFSLIQNELRSDDLQKMIQKNHAVDDNNIFMLASQNDFEIYSLIRGFAKKILSEDQFKKLYDEFTTCWNNLQP